jgi:hypothetical protein
MPSKTLSVPLRDSLLERSVSAVVVGAGEELHSSLALVNGTSES